MKELEDDIPTSGKHPENDEGDFETGTNVSAQEPPAPIASQSIDEGKESPGEKSEVATYQLLHNEESGHYHVRALREDAPDPLEGFEEVKQFDERPTYDDATSGMPDGPRYVVFENTDTGEVFVDLESNVSDNWSDNDRFDSFTLFESEEEASAYADKKQKS